MTLEEWWESQPKPGIDRTPAACLERLRDFAEAPYESGHADEAFEDLDALERALGL